MVVPTSAVPRTSISLLPAVVAAGQESAMVVAGAASMVLALWMMVGDAIRLTTAYVVPMLTDGHLMQYQGLGNSM